MEPPNASSVEVPTSAKSTWPISSQFSANLFRLFILAQPNKSRMPPVIVTSPLHELELPDELGLQPPAFRHLGRREPGTPRPAFSGGFANGHSLISSGVILLNNSARDEGVNPFRVRAAVHQLVAVVVADHDGIEVL